MRRLTMPDDTPAPVARHPWTDAAGKPWDLDSFTDECFECGRTPDAHPQTPAPVAQPLTCNGCYHPAHPVAACHEYVPNGDPGNGPAYCPCAWELEAMDEELMRLRAARSVPDNAALREAARELVDALDEGRPVTNKVLRVRKALAAAPASPSGSSPVPAGLTYTLLEDSAVGVGPATSSEGDMLPAGTVVVIASPADPHGSSSPAGHADHEEATNGS
jgi:hypothetical protein